MIQTIPVALLTVPSLFRRAENRVRDHLEQILNTFYVETSDHFVLATESLLRDVQKKY